MNHTSSGNGARSLDFLIIGAQKSGTTSLFRYLSAHPSIYMPPQKELPFFHDEANFRRGGDWYLEEYFADAPPGSRAGEASPYCMCYDYIPKRILEVARDVRLIALLRNPIDRAFSHYRMTRRRGFESRSFEEVVAAGTGAHTDGDNVDIHRDYLRFSEYGRILCGYREFFAREQIRLVFTEDLESRPLDVVQELFEYIGVDRNFVPDTIRRRFHVGGARRIGLPIEIARWFVNWARGKPVLGKLVGRQRGDSLVFRLETELAWKSAAPERMPDALRAALAERFAPDVQLLERSFGIKAPWSEFAAADHAGIDAYAEARLRSGNG